LEFQGHKPAVPLSQALGLGRWDSADLSPSKDAGTVSGTPVGQSGTLVPDRYGRVLTILEARCPDHVPVERWQQAVEDGRRFLATWGDQAEALGWVPRDLFGLHKPLAKPHPSYSRLSRYDETGLIWLLCGREVIELTNVAASIRNPNGNVTVVYREALRRLSLDCGSLPT
jgi:hypothetical protein